MNPILFALCIGLDEYAHPDIRNLQGCEKDVDSLQDVLFLRFPHAQILSLKRQAATRKGILDSFTAHLLENDCISRGDPILIYFAGYGQRLKGESREVDALIPFDYAPDVPPIFDATLHRLLKMLVQTKGPHVTLILDCCFSPVFALSTNVRRIQTPSWLSHLVDSDLRREENNLADYHGFFSEDQPYVVIAASNRNRHCKETPMGGFFTQNMVSIMRSSWPLSCRELTVLTQRWETGSRSQVSVCYGPHLDRLLCTTPKLLPIAKLRVFSSNIDLHAKSTEDSVFLVSRRGNANVVVYAASQSEAHIERLDRVTAQYGTPLIPFALAKAAQVLNGIARFNHYLNLRPSADRHYWHRVQRRLLRWRKSGYPSLSIEVYHFRPEDEDDDHAWISQNILHSGVALLDQVPNNHVLGLKLTNTGDQAMYPYVLHFDTGTYEINEWYSPFREDEGMPPNLLKPDESLIFGRCPDMNALALDNAEPSFRIVLDEDKIERTAEVFKIILAQKPIAVGYMAQASPITSGGERFEKVEVQEGIPGVWRTETVTLAVPANFRNGGHLHSSPRAVPLGLWRRIKEKVAYALRTLFGSQNQSRLE
ncbi:hypothetical protein MIND_01011300 [Mycena indigotica]|uniref:Peptidase C14 caspase domain-containing protein n=1 Tax=Mycena indigotica TaxID=2126181 RepID=A0A8H6S8D4_9AGAR|nr:uncharacterized protein MIND_01011300 [Mycena indigotica]KAF7294739.1 hypothetical protein MIND_01011300 [Mycena indigotica]